MQSAMLKEVRKMRKLGQGSYGEAFLGEKSFEEVAAPFVLKVVVVAEGETELMTATENEAVLHKLVSDEAVRRGLAALPAPRFYRCFREGNDFFVIMEAMQGDLDSPAKLTEIEHQRFRKLARLLVRMAADLAFVQSLGITHCDVKPSNFFHSTDVLDARLADFSLAVKNSPCPGASTDFAPPEYFGTSLPELYQRSDIFSFGVTLVRIVSYLRSSISDIVESNYYEKYAHFNQKYLLEPLHKVYRNQVCMVTESGVNVLQRHWLIGQLEALNVAMLDFDPAKRPDSLQVLHRIAAIAISDYQENAGSFDAQLAQVEAAISSRYSKAEDALFLVEHFEKNKMEDLVKQTFI